MIEQQTYLIVGLGNPGPIYAKNRHNAGFMCVDRIAIRNNLRFDTRRLRAEIARGVIDGRNVMLAKPQTYMNDSGISVAEILHWYKIPTANLLVIYDEMDLPTGTIRLRERGSAAGHNGMKSIIAHIGQDFNRLRIGVDRPAPGMNREYLLNNFSRQDIPLITEAIDVAAEAAEVWLRQGIISAMNRYNAGKPDNPSDKDDKPNKPDAPRQVLAI
jgi:PTH1 family peptidyl-tRNA hydrolase